MLFSWKWRYLRPLLKHFLSPQAHHFIRDIRGRFQPTLSQHDPIPLRIPSQYRHVRLVVSEHLPIVSIVTPALNQGQFLERTIQSVLKQEYPTLEYVVQDGGSTDGTARILAEYRSKLSQVASLKDAGQANALNCGFQRSTGEIMAWLNADDLLLPGTISYVVNFFLSHPDVDVVYGHRICIDAHDREVGRWILPPHADAVLPWANYIPQETLFWRRRIWEKAGGYLDEAYQFAMDWELLLRFQQAGARFARLPRFLGAFRVHADQKTAVLAHIGAQDAQRLHSQYHGRPVTWLEIRYHVRTYLAHSTWLYFLHKLRLFRQ
jgi:glycosyltransferase involved in cell wall biosynthesis